MILSIKSARMPQRTNRWNKHSRFKTLYMIQCNLSAQKKIYKMIKRCFCVLLEFWTKIAYDQGFCQNCGTRVQDAYLEGSGEMLQNLMGGPAQATGGLKVWLWIMIVSGIIGVIAIIIFWVYYLQLVATFRDLEGQSALISNLESQHSRS